MRNELYWQDRAHYRRYFRHWQSDRDSICRIGCHGSGQPLPSGTRLTLISNDKPDRFFTVIKFWVDETSGVALTVRGGVPSYQVEDEEGRIDLLLHLGIEEQTERSLVSLAARSGRL